MDAKANNAIDKARKLQRKLYLAAKANSKRRFHAILDKVYRKDILEESWKRVKANGGACGIDNLIIDDVKVYGENKFLQEIHQELVSGKYQPKPVKRVYIPKGKIDKRPLGIPTVKDRVIQTAEL